MFGFWTLLSVVTVIGMLKLNMSRQIAKSNILKNFLVTF